MPEHIDEGRLSPFDRKEVTISWRGDGAYVAMNSVDVADDSERRMIRVFTREGQLDSVTEPVDGLEGALSWRPAGNLVASIQRLQDRVDVIFFERNGLRHGQFTLRLSQDDMRTWAAAISVAWNVDSSVLAVTFLDRIQLWTMGNYHYYLKQEILLPPDVDPVQVTWHSEKALYLTASSRQTLLVLNYVMAIAGGSASSPHDIGLIGVVDGRTIKLTPLRLANVPPPMALMDVGVSQNLSLIHI